MASNSEKIEANKRLLGKQITIKDEDGIWTGDVIGVIDAETFRVKESNGVEHLVDVFEIVGT